MKREGATTVLTVSIPKKLAARLESFVAKRAARTGGMSNKSAVVTAAIAAALARWKP